MNSIVEKVKLIAEEYANKLEYKVVKVTFEKEDNMKMLRVTIKNNPRFDIDECTKLFELISDRLDEEDFIDEEYYLEVTSEGLEKELDTDEDIKDAIGEYIYVKLYEKVDSIKEVYGDLISFDGDILIISYMDKTRKKQLEVQKNKICKIRLAVKF